MDATQLFTIILGTVLIVVFLADIIITARSMHKNRCDGELIVVRDNDDSSCYLFLELSKNTAELKDGDTVSFTVSTRSH